MTDIVERLRLIELIEQLRQAALTRDDYRWEAADTITALRAENKRLRAALTPFADAAARYDPDEGDNILDAWDWSATIGQLRAARAALGGPHDHGDIPEQEQS